MLIAGDIGGTKANLALFDKVGDDYTFFKLTTFKSKNYADFASILKEYIQIENLEAKGIEGACFAIAGPVYEGVCKATNLPWIVDANHLTTVTSIPHVSLINDLEANAYSIDILPQESFYSLHAGVVKKGNRMVVSPGTGLGEAGIIWNGEKYLPFACEGGHCDFAPINALQIELLSYLMKKFGHASYERVLSGPGVYNIYRFFIEEKKYEEDPFIAKEIEENDKAATITAYGFNGKSRACQEACELFASIFGSEVGNCALKFMAVGGIYLGGGIPPKILPSLIKSIFFDSYKAKGRFSSLLEDIPIQVILDDKASLKGAAYYCRQKIKQLNLH